MSDPMICGTLGANVQFQANAELMSAYEMAEKDRLDRQSNQEFWEKQGQIKTARRMLARNMSYEDIADITDLSISEISALAAAR